MKITEMINQIIRKIFCSELLKEREELKNQLEQYLPTFRFQYTERIGGDEIYKALKATFPEASIRMADSYYDMVTWDELLKWLNEDSLSEMKWCEDVFDCDDFADESACRMHLLGRIQGKNFAYRIAWGNTPMGYHAFCLAYVLKDDDKHVIVIEPQNDDTRGWKKSDYKPDFIKM